VGRRRERRGQNDVVLGLGDGEAHYGMICDVSFPTFLLTYWARDRNHRPIQRCIDADSAFDLLK
jgi:N-acyl-D-aspartate/D-glutamate deacylase